MLLALLLEMAGRVLRHLYLEQLQPMLAAVEVGQTELLALAVLVVAVMDRQLQTVAMAQPIPEVAAVEPLIFQRVAQEALV